MKKLYYLLFFITGILNAQIVTIPDANFKAKLIASTPTNQTAINLAGLFFKIDANSDGEIQLAEALQIKNLYVQESNILDVTGIASFINMIEFKCHTNNINNLDISQNLNLKILDCRTNNLTNLNVQQNSNLEFLSCRQNNLTALDVSQNINLNYLHCGYNNLNTINVTSNINLLQLECHSTNITVLDVTQNANLKHLQCSGNNLNVIDVTQNSQLIYLDCGLMNLSSIDVSQNTALEKLFCYYNNLTSVDVSNNPQLIWLYVNDNQLPSLDVSNNLNLVRLHFQNNQLTTLNLNQHLQLEQLYCSNNNLSTLFIKNGMDENLTIDQNPNLNYICADESQVESIQDIANSSALVSSFCSFIPGGNYNSISGAVRFDADTNGCSTSDPLLPNSIRLDLSDGNITSGMYPNSFGNYILYGDVGNYTLTTQLENPNWFTVSPVSLNVNFSQPNTTLTQDICITSNGIHNDVDVILVPIANMPPRPGFDTTYYIFYENKGTEILSGAINLMFQDNVLDFISSSNVPNSVVANVLEWNYSNLLPFEKRFIRVAFNINSPTETPAVNIGDLLSFQVSIDPVVNDETPLDNVFNLKQVVVGSFDPNDIHCLEGDEVSPTKIGDYLHYTINFENVGTYPADFVVVKNKIDSSQFDINSLQIISSSHTMETRVAGDEVTFYFENINLQLNQYGSIVYKIKTKNSLVENDSVNNNAKIYFDYNFPIVTNTATTIFKENIDEGSSNFDDIYSISIFPNPSTSIVNVQSKSIINSIQLFDVQGKMLQNQIINDQFAKIDISRESKGIYFFKIITNNESKMAKIVKE